MRAARQICQNQPLVLPMTAFRSMPVARMPSYITLKALCKVDEALHFLAPQVEFVIKLRLLSHFRLGVMAYVAATIATYCIPLLVVEGLQNTIRVLEFVIQFAFMAALIVLFRCACQCSAGIGLQRIVLCTTAIVLRLISFYGGADSAFHILLPCRLSNECPPDSRQHRSALLPIIARNSNAMRLEPTHCVSRLIRRRRPIRENPYLMAGVSAEDADMRGVGEFSTELSLVEDGPSRPVAPVDEASPAGSRAGRHHHHPVRLAFGGLGCVFLCGCGRGRTAVACASVMWYLESLFAGGVAARCIIRTTQSHTQPSLILPPPLVCIRSVVAAARPHLAVAAPAAAVQRRQGQRCRSAARRHHRRGRGRRHRPTSTKTSRWSEGLLRRLEWWPCCDAVWSGGLLRRCGEAILLWRCFCLLLCICMPAGLCAEQTCRICS